MKVLVTGNRGYIGAHLVQLLRERDYNVVGCDLNLYPDAVWEDLVAPDQEFLGDFRSLSVEDLRGFDCIMHLGAISNDPMGELSLGLTESVNGEGSILLAKRAKEAGVGRFLFASSCSMYGAGAALDLDESAPLNPVSAYAQSKVDAENGIRALASADFAPAFLRNATAYGASPVLRVDLVLNNLLGSALSYGQLRVMSDGSPWRPLIHCRDIARAFVAFAEAERDAIYNMAINVGSNKENYQVRDVVDIIQHLLPDVAVVFTGEVGADPRNYRVNFDLLGARIPNFKLEYTLARGAEELLMKMREHNFDKQAFEGDRYVRLRALRKQLKRLEA